MAKRSFYVKSSGYCKTKQTSPHIALISPRTVLALSVITGGGCEGEAVVVSCSETNPDLADLDIWTIIIVIVQKDTWLKKQLVLEGKLQTPIRAD